MIENVDPQQWNALLNSDYPFLQHAFLHALETSGSVTRDTGWLAAHSLVYDQQTLVAAAPAYIKTHSWGEYVFDQQWANAYQQQGIAYYPKLVCSVPYTPCSGPRLLGDVHLLANQAKAQCAEQQLSGAHLLFLPRESAEALEAQGWHIRNDVQFHWHNKQYTSFDHFLGELSASKRKKIKRERRRIAEQKVTFETRSGSEIDSELWDVIYGFYCNTYAVRGQSAYLTRQFFDLICQSLPEQLVVFIARYQGAPVATAICFRDSTTLYGRHWGAEASYHSLHFETCYYQGIDYCIANGLQHFDAGAQGPHKLSRGFTAQKTYSAHWLAQPQFNDAIGRFVEQESQSIEQYANDVEAHSPFRQRP